MAPGVTLTFLRLDSDADIALHAAEALLAPDEIARAARFRFDRDRHRYIRARGALRQVLGQAMDRAPESLVFTYGDRGKPALEDGPAFNLSHSGDRGVVALGGDAPLGVDIEKCGRKIRDLDALAERCFGAVERAAIEAAPDPLRHFLTFWTAKEARMKLTGEGLGLDPQAIHLVLDAGGRATGFSAPDPRARLYPFAEDDLVGAVAL